MKSTKALARNEQIDHQLVKRCRKGDRRAQRSLYERHKVKQFGICLRYAKTREEAEDMLQEGFTKAFKNLKQYEATGPFGAWLSRVMVNTALMYLRKYRKMKFSDKEQNELENTLFVKEDIHDKMNADTIIALVQTLPRGYQTVFNLYAIEGYSHKEIAQQLGISEGTSRSQYLRAKAAMRGLLEKVMDT